MRPVLDYANWIGVQDAMEGQRLVDIGAPAPRVEVTGNVKFDLDPDGHPCPAVAGPGALLVAGSTHEPEERWMLQILAELRRLPEKDIPDCAGFSFAFKARQPAHSALCNSWRNAEGGRKDKQAGISFDKNCLRPAHAQLRLVLAPRDSGRGRTLEKQAEQAGFRVRRWSTGGWEQGEWDVLVLDTIGQLMPFYAGADVVVMGGSFADCGGHNILEPAALGRPIVVGPHMENFQGILECFLAREALVQVAGPQGLEQALVQLLAEPELCRRLGERARRCIEAKRGAAGRSARTVLGLMDQEATSQAKS